MRLAEVQKKARSFGIRDTWKFPKKALIKAIQRKEGNFDCFATAQGSCAQMECCWRTDCLK